MRSYLARRVERLEARLAGAGDDLEYRRRYRWYYMALSRYGLRTRRERKEAAHRLASGRPTAADRIRLYEAATRAGAQLGPAPPAHPRIAEEARRRIAEYEEFKRNREEKGYLHE